MPDDHRHTASPPGPSAPPKVPGHMGYPRQKVIDAARTVFGALSILEDLGMDVADLKRQAKWTLEATGLREADLPPQPPNPVAHDHTHRVETSTSGLHKRCTEQGCDWSYEYD